MREQALFHSGQTQETTLGTDCNVWIATATISSMDQTNETCTKQKFKKTTTNIPNMERDRSRDLRQSNN